MELALQNWHKDTLGEHFQQAQKYKFFKLSYLGRQIENIKDYKKLDYSTISITLYLLSVLLINNNTNFP
jgi:hypothetical protein